MIKVYFSQRKEILLSYGPKITEDPVTKLS
ncbi:polysaccharide biosynthesis-related protein [Sulfolobus tengchongensis spindle-shaped virus 3]|nr:polysaccharide biosynthesis-related protein [Sulfolobus tengchongensis spindle-shaped virus 3]